MKPQAFGNYYDGEGSCAFGAAFDAIGIRASLTTTIPDEWTPIHTIMDKTHCPECGRVRNSVISDSLIPHLNDVHRWSRERIADFVEQIENAQEELLPELLEALPIPEEVQR